ncbi:hypothetical protein CC2G_000590 [Coprinopsis cinerea AmutBmut pab1-1]|nr:hypothetical protein CC2G_000590 [Coprinopsis cinerea AmutBmut pab1-1]
MILAIHLAPLGLDKLEVNGLLLFYTSFLPQEGFFRMEGYYAGQAIRVAFAFMGFAAGAARSRQELPHQFSAKIGDLTVRKIFLHLHVCWEPRGSRSSAYHIQR